MSYTDIATKSIEEQLKAIDPDIKKAAEIVTRKAKGGDQDAQMMLATMYSLGIGVEQDHGQMAAWYKVLADKGVAAAQCSLGKCYETGTGVAQDMAHAI